MFSCDQGQQTRLITTLVGLLATLLVTWSTRAESNTTGRSFSVLSYNVHGLFRLFARDDPGDRSPTIGWLASEYDIVLLQEDFEYSDAIAAQIGESVRFRGNGMGFDLRRVAVKIVLLPFQFLIPHFSPPYGAGVTTYVGADLTVAPDVTRENYTACAGWVRRGGDCWANKGFLRVRIRTAEGAEVDIYNTHLD